MKPKPFRRPGIVLLSILLPLTPLQAEEPALRDLLRDALFTEEVTRDPAKAAEQYQQLLTRHDEQRAYAATALFRLAEVRRKQGRNEEAVALYQRLIREFPGAPAEGKLAVENLAALGAEVPGPGDSASDEETKELQRLEEFARTAPDVLKDPQTLEAAARKGWSRVANLLLGAGNDPYQSSALAVAAHRGFLDICRLILEKAGDPPHQRAAEAMESVIDGGRVEVLKLFLEKGFDPNRPDTHQRARLAQAVAVAPGKWNREITELLLASGADVDAMAIEPGSPLLEALSLQNAEAANLLLDHDAKPDLPDLNGITPLHVAATFDTEEVRGIIRRLLDAGADPLAKAPNKGRLNIRAGDTPFTLALKAKQPELAKLLATAAGKEHASRLLVQVITLNGDHELVDFLLDNGADPNFRVDRGSEKTDLIQLLAHQSGTKGLIEKLIAKGAKPDEKWVKNSFNYKNSFNFPGQSALPDVRILPLLYRSFLIPQLAEEPAVSLVTSDFRGNPPLELAKRSDINTPPPSLEWLLLAKQSHRWPSVTISGQLHWPRQINIWRKNENGTVERTSLTIESSEPLPELKWGDVIELTHKEEIPPLHNIEFRDGLPGDIVWHLRKRVSFPVTVEIGGETRQLMLRGDRLIFDPTKDESPWVGAGRLIELLWQPLHPHPSLDGIEIIVVREGWQDIRLRYNDQATAAFELKEADVVRLQVPKSLIEGAESRRQKQVTLTSPGISFTRQFGVRWPGEHLEPPPGVERSPRGIMEPTVPTLFQALTAALVSPQIPYDKPPENPAEIPAWLLEKTADHPPSILPHPDFSNIRLRRLRDDGSEEIRNIDLAAIIAGSSDEASAEEAREADIPLMGGDIIELSISADKAGESWTGISAKEASFFAKALKARVQLIEPKGEVSLKDAIYEPLAYEETEAGWIPLRKSLPPGPAPFMTLGDTLGSEGRVEEVTRNGTNHAQLNLYPASVFVRDGDLIRLRPLQGAQRRVIPPPSR